MNNAWYPLALEFAENELKAKKKESGITILSDFVEINRNEYFPELDISELENFITEEYEEFELWIKTQGIPWLLFGPRGKWILKTAKTEEKLAREKEIFNIDSRLNISEADRKLLNEDEINLNEQCIGFYEKLLERLKVFTMPNELAECTYRLAVCHENLADISCEKLIELWGNAAEAAIKANKNHLAYKSFNKVADLYKSNNEHLKAATNFEKAFENRDQANNTKEDLRGYIRIARYARVQYDLDGDHKSASRMFIFEKDTEKKAGNFLDKLILNTHKYTSYYGELPILVCIYIFIVLFVSTFAYYYVGTSDFCPSTQLLSDSKEVIKNTSLEVDCTSRWENFGNSIYMSVVTFTTLGYGEITPVNLVGKLTTIILSVFGVLLTSLFMVTFVRKYSRP